LVIDSYFKPNARHSHPKLESLCFDYLEVTIYSLYQSTGHSCLVCVRPETAFIEG